MRRVGVLDSGIGGLAFVKSILTKPWAVDLVYISDEDNVPYGGKSEVWLKNQVSKMCEVLIAKHVDCILLACNTATAWTIDHLRSKVDIPIFGVEPFLSYPTKTYDGHGKKNAYALILTQATRASRRFEILRSQWDPNHWVDVFELQNLALYIQNLKTKPWHELEPAFIKEMVPLTLKPYTHVILGCTHYGLLAQWIAKTLNVVVVDPVEHVLAHLESQMNFTVGKANTSFAYSANMGRDWSNVMLETHFRFL